MASAPIKRVNTRNPPRKIDILTMLAPTLILAVQRGLQLKMVAILGAWVALIQGQVLEKTADQMDPSLSLPARRRGKILARRYSQDSARSRRPSTSSTSQPSRSGMAQSKAKSLRMKDWHSIEPRIDRFSITCVTARIR